jgi:hypothetical protein
MVWAPGVRSGVRNPLGSVGWLGWGLVNIRRSELGTDISPRWLLPPVAVAGGPGHYYSREATEEFDPYGAENKGGPRPSQRPLRITDRIA